MTGSAEFRYEELPAAVDALRILIVKPCTSFDDDIECSLETKLFSNRPRYIALSYTWQDYDAALAPIESARTENSVGGHENIATNDPAILLNQFPFNVQRNLYRALKHLRSLEHPLNLWVDAICINQNDINERNKQVTMMTFIYQNARRVVGWLGIDVNREDQWKNGNSRNLAKLINGSEDIPYSGEPDGETVDRIMTNQYWSRLWIVQEVCTPQHLLFVRGSNIWRYENVESWSGVRRCLETDSHSRGRNDDSRSHFIRLITTRGKRHSDEMRLERLIERFVSNGCAETRDRVYGFLGLANDVNSASSAGGEADPDELDDLRLQLGDRWQHRNINRARVNIKVDYDMPLYHIWVSVVKHLLFTATPVNNPALRIDPDRRIDERLLSLVRSAGIVQAAFDQKIEEELKTRVPRAS